jgi:hypothetical protein
VGLGAWIGGFLTGFLARGGIVNFTVRRYATSIPQYTAIYAGGSGDVATLRFYVINGVLLTVVVGLASGTTLSIWATRRHASP